MSALSVVQNSEHALERAVAALSVLFIACVLALLAALVRSPGYDLPASVIARFSISPVLDPRGHAAQVRERELQRRFDQAVVMLHAKKYDYAITALHRVIALSPRMPEAHVNMGYALLGLKNYAAARDFFTGAIELRPYQANAYWGLAVALEGTNDLPGAIGAMRTYIHLTSADPNAQEYLRKARSALWEWESQLKRGPLPPEEQEWLTRRGKEWVERNEPGVDAPAQPERSIDLTR